MIIYIFLLILIIIILYIYKFASAEKYRILTNKDKSYIESLLPAGTYFSRNFNIQGIMIDKTYLIYEKNKIKYFLPDLNLYKIFSIYKKIYKAPEYFFHIYNEITKIQFNKLNPTKLLTGAHFSPIYKETRFLGYRLTTTATYLTEEELQYSSNINKFPIYFFPAQKPPANSPEPIDIYKLFTEYNIKTILCYSDNINIISVCLYMGAHFVNKLDYKNIRLSYGTIYKEYDLVITGKYMATKYIPVPYKYKYESGKMYKYTSINTLPKT